MFDFVGSFFSKIGVSIGTILIALGGFFGAGSIEERVIPAIEVTPEASAPSQEEPLASVAPKSLTPQTQAVPSPTSPPKVETRTAVTTLQIENVKILVEVGRATITWTTTLPAESRLIFDNGEGRVFESENGLSTDHVVHTVGLEESEEYDFKITATTEGKAQYDDYYDTLYAPKKYMASFGANENDCTVIVIKDTAGHIAIGKQITFSAYQVLSSTNIARGNSSETTNARGEVEYCELANKFKITGEGLDVTISK